MLPPRNEGLIKNYFASAVIPARTIVKYGADEQHVTPAAAAADKSIGVSDLGADAIGDRVDIVQDGVAWVKYGGTVAVGDQLTADATGRAIATTTGGNRVIGIAQIAGVVNDIGSVHLKQGTL